MKPYHNFPTDMLTAYVHLPAWQSWYVWRKFVKTHACEDLLSRALSNRERQDKMNLVLRVGGWLVLLIQCAMVRPCGGGARREPCYGHSPYLCHRPAAGTLQMHRG